MLYVEKLNTLFLSSFFFEYIHAVKFFLLFLKISHDPSNGVSHFVNKHTQQITRETQGNKFDL